MSAPDWLDRLLEHEPLVRAGAFLGVLAVMAAWERAAPRRKPSTARALRWTNNLGLVLLDALLLRLLFPAAGVGMAVFAAREGWGLLHHLEAPLALGLPISLIVLDLAIWLQHVMMHAVPALWRLHRVHHADPDFDLTTGLRFHPLEILLSMGFKFAVIAALGPPVIAVLIFEIGLNGLAMFNHSNARLPPRLDALLRLVVVTPDMHRVHHSVEEDETDSNFGFNLPWWDRWFGTYRAQPRAGHEAMTIGLRGWRDPRQVSRLPGLLAMPFRGPVEGRDSARGGPRPGCRE